MIRVVERCNGELTFLPNFARNQQRWATRGAKRWRIQNFEMGCRERGKAKKQNKSKKLTD